MSAALGRLLETDTPAGLTALSAQIRREHPGDPEADTVARQAGLKAGRLRKEI